MAEPGQSHATAAGLQRAPLSAQVADAGMMLYLSSPYSDKIIRPLMQIKDHRMFLVLDQVADLACGATFSQGVATKGYHGPQHA